MSSIRKTMIFKEQVWVDSDFTKIKAGDLFKLYEPDGSRVADPRGKTEWIAEGDSFINSSGIAEVYMII